MRRYVRDAGPLLPTAAHTDARRLHDTKPAQGGAALLRAYDGLERRIDVLAEAEELAAISPDLDGNEIMQVLGIPAGRVVGEAYKYLLELRLDRGPLEPERRRRNAAVVAGAWAGLRAVRCLLAAPARWSTAGSRQEVTGQ